MTQILGLALSLDMVGRTGGDRSHRAQSKGGQFEEEGPRWARAGRRAYRSKQGQHWPLKDSGKVQVLNSALCDFKCTLKMLQAFPLMPQVPAP